MPVLPAGRASAVDALRRRCLSWSCYRRWLLPGARGAAAEDRTVRRSPRSQLVTNAKERPLPNATAIVTAGWIVPGMPAASPHERIVAVARDMFCRDGIHATEVDRSLATAGASKLTLYGHFGPKDALLHEVLRREGLARRDSFFSALLATSDDPATRLRGVVSALAHWFDGERFHGCTFMNAVAEHTKGDSRLRALAADHHREILDFLAGQAEAAGYAEPRLLARPILLLLDGTIAALMGAATRRSSSWPNASWARCWPRRRRRAPRRRPSRRLERPGGRAARPLAPVRRPRRSGCGDGAGRAGIPPAGRRSSSRAPRSAGRRCAHRRGR